MKMICTSIAICLAGVGVSALAEETTSDTAVEAKPEVLVVARDDKGKATRVSVNGREYALCSESVQDRCISPRAAGLNWGAQPLDHWPGQTSTSLKERKALEKTAGSQSDKPATPAA